MSFTNTVEVVGDEALTNSIIDRSITELHDNISTSIGQYALRGCKALTNVNFPSVTSTGTAAMYQCTALAKADFAAAVAFGNNTFYGCSALTALILRNTAQLSTLTGNLSGTAIATGTGYIYVPLALVDSYKAASGWSTYANQIRAIEDYIGICDPYTWEGVAANIDAGTYASVYSLGDCVELDIGSEGQVNMEIVAIDVDTLADGSGTAPISWISKELLTTSCKMNPSLVTNDDGTYQEGTGSIGGWDKCEMRTYLNDTILPLISADVQAMIKPVTKYSDSYNTAGTAVNSVATVDSVWIPSRREAFGGTNYETTGATYTGLFTANSARIKCKVGSTSTTYWWLRSANSLERFYSVYISGAVNNAIADGFYGVALGFCT